MARKSKLQRFAELNTFPNVVQNFDYKSPVLINHQGEQVDYRGRWVECFFGNKNPLVLELACGKGEYTLGLASMYPHKNFVGIDIKGNRIWRGAKTALEKGYPNVGFLRTRIELLPHFFEAHEVAEIWITFPDPQPKSPNRRLTAPHFLEKYRHIGIQPVRVHLKTDDADLYHYSVEVMSQLHAKILTASEDIDADGLRWGELSICTFYETQHLAAGKKIKYLEVLL